LLAIAAAIGVGNGQSCAEAAPDALTGDTFAVVSFGCADVEMAALTDGTFGGAAFAEADVGVSVADTVGVTAFA
jgi:hypothetical protein